MITITLTEEEAGVVAAALGVKLEELQALPELARTLVGKDRIAGVEAILKRTLKELETQIKK